jgi:hypothetical protein
MGSTHRSFRLEGPGCQPADVFLESLSERNGYHQSANTSEVTTLCDDVSDTTRCTNNANVVCAEDPDNDIDAFARFMSTKAPSRDTALANTSSARAGRRFSIPSVATSATSKH